jgi:hypothetical protein
MDDEELHSRLAAAVTPTGSMSTLIHETGQQGLPRWAAWTLAIVWMLAAGAAVVGYLATHAWLVVGVFGGVAFIVSIGVANAVQLMRRGAR